MGPGSQPTAAVDRQVLLKLSYGLFVLTAREGDRDNGCVINTVAQATDTPIRLSATVNKRNLTHGMIFNTRLFNVSILTEETPFALIERFGYRSGRDADKFLEFSETGRAANGIRFVAASANAVISARVLETHDCGTHTLFMAETTQAFALGDGPSLTYRYYFDHIKPKPRPSGLARGFVCQICGHVHAGDTLPADFVCPTCKHRAGDFKPVVGG